MAGDRQAEDARGSGAVDFEIGLPEFLDDARFHQPERAAAGDRAQHRQWRTAGIRPQERHAAIRHRPGKPLRSEEHTSELQSLMRISYAVFCLKKKIKKEHKK